MESSRAYSLSLILGLLVLCFLLGLGLGMFITQRMYEKSIKELSFLSQAQGANTIMARRMRAINQAIKEGKTEYEFEAGYLPPLSGKK